MMMRENDLKGDQVCMGPYWFIVSRKVCRFFGSKTCGFSNRVMIIVFDAGAGVITGGRFDRSSVSVERGDDERRLGSGVASEEVGEGGSVLDILKS